MKASTELSDLAGHFFHVVREGEISEQGKVISRVEPGYYLIKNFSWLSGEETTRRIVKLRQMLLWTFYASVEQMTDAYDRAK